MNVFLHGWGFSKKIWKDFYNLDNSIFLDLPFHGELKKFSTENILENYVEHINAFVKEPSVFIGWSLGASVSILFYLKYPEKVKKLILIGFSPKFKSESLGHPPKYVKAFLLSLRKDFENTVYNFRVLSSDKKFENIPLPEKKGATKILNEYINLDLTDDLKKITVPAVIIHGKKDKVVNYKVSYFVNQKIKNSELFLYPYNHSPFYNNPDIIVNCI